MQSLTIDDIYAEYGVYMHHSLFAGAVIEKMSRSLLRAHNEGLPLPSTEDAASSLSSLDPRYDEFVRMKRIGLPVSVITSQMTCAGLEPNKLFPDAELEDVQQQASFLRSLQSPTNCQLKKVTQEGSAKVGGPHSECAAFRDLLNKRFSLSEGKELFERHQPVAILQERMKSVRPEESDSDEWSDN